MDQIRRGKRLATALALTLVVAACSAAATPVPATPAPTPTATPAPTPTPTATPAPSPTPTPSARPTIAIQSMKVTLPSNWQSVEMTEAALRAGIDSIAPNNPSLAATLRQLLDSGAYRQISIYAIGYTNTNAMQGVLTGNAFAAGPASIDLAEPILQATFKQLGAIALTSKRVTLPAGETIVTNYTMPLNANGTTVYLPYRVFDTLSGGAMYQLSFSCAPNAEVGCMADADLIANSLVLGK